MYRIEHRLTRKCNFACSYCYEVFDDTFENVPVDFDRLSKFIERVLSSYDTLEYNIIGGEPTKHPQFKKLIQFLDTFDNVNILITTNCSKPIKVKTSKNIEFVASFHPEFISVENFLSNINDSVNYSNTVLRCINVVDSDKINKDDYNLYFKLKKFAKNININENQIHIYPLLPNLNVEPKISQPNNEEISKEIQDMWYFKNGLYDNWKSFESKTLGKQCSVNNFECVVQENLVYQCVYFANKEKKGTEFEDFSFDEPITCRFKYCLFNGLQVG